MSFNPHALPAHFWTPFVVESDCRLIPRPLGLPGNAGIGDRLRAAAFAEAQAAAAFTWAADSFKDAPHELKTHWIELANDEKRHCQWFLTRMDELQILVNERPVHDALWRSLTICTTPSSFCHLMAGAEERGRKAGERIAKHLATKDPITAEIFKKIAFEEIAHIKVAYDFYPAESS